MSSNGKYDWKYRSIGGVMRVEIASGADIAHLGELDKKLWTVLSCPTKGLEFCEKTLSLLDEDKDGKIRVKEIVDTANWLCDALKNPDVLLKGEDGLDLCEFSDTALGIRLGKTARQIVDAVGNGRERITIADTSDSMAIFSKTRFNGDGIITPTTVADERLQEVVKLIIDTFGSLKDRSGDEGVDADKVEKFYAACEAYTQWYEAASDENLPYGEQTEAALNICEVMKEKVADYFMRCKLVAFDEECLKALDVQVAKIEGISDKDLTQCVEDIAGYPLARPRKEAVLDLATGINPAWKSQWEQLKRLVLNQEFGEKGCFNEEEWNGVLAKFAAYIKWKGDKAGAEVEKLGIEKIKQLLTDNCKGELMQLVEEDKSVAEEVSSIEEVEKLLYLNRDFYHLLRNYVTFADFYHRKEGNEAIFKAGKLFIDQRCCELCIKVDDAIKHSVSAGLSGMYLIYCKCTSKTNAKPIDIVAVMTDGDVDDLRVGKNAVFYDRKGVDWDATVTKIVDNPISIRQAFLSPYKKFWNWCTEKINKSAAEKETASLNKLTSGADAKMAEMKASQVAKAAGEEVPVPAVPATDKAKPQPFDIAKFAGIFAALGMAVGFITSAVTGLTATIAANPLNLLILIIGIVLVISGPSMFLAWSKLHKRNLGPVLNANGWAINSKVLVNIVFGGTLTSIAKYPKIDTHMVKDPFREKKKPLWVKIILWVLIVAVILYLLLWWAGKLPWMRF